MVIIAHGGCPYLMFETNLTNTAWLGGRTLHSSRSESKIRMRLTIFKASGALGRSLRQFGRHKAVLTAADAAASQLKPEPSIPVSVPRKQLSH